jgi:hypothetical protein
MWYVVGAGLIDSNIAGFNVHPDTTTKYVMALDVCGTISYDTVTVMVAPENTPVLISMNNVQVYPNPVGDVLHICLTPRAPLLPYGNSKGEGDVTYKLQSVLGTAVQWGVLHRGNNTVAVQDIIPGTYLLELTGAYGEKKVVRVMK